MVASCNNSQGAPESHSKLAPFFAKVRDNAHNIHAVWKNGWNCCCSGTHKALLQLEMRVDDRASEFNVLLAIPERVDNFNTATSIVYIQQDAIIQISNSDEEGDEEGVQEGVQEGGDLLAEPQRASGSSANVDPSTSEDNSERSNTVTSTHSDEDNSGLRKRQERWASINEWKSRLGTSLR